MATSKVQDADTAIEPNMEPQRVRERTEIPGASGMSVSPSRPETKKPRGDDLPPAPPLPGGTAGTAGHSNAMALDEEPPKKSIEEMMAEMMLDMKEMKGMVCKNVEEATSLASAAMQTATETKNAVASVQAEMKELKEVTVTKDDVQQMVHDQLAGKYPAPPQQHSEPRMKGGGKGMKGEKKREEQSRTLIFSNFPKDTQEDEIVDMIRAQMVDVIGEVEEVFAYAKTGSRGAAKFTSEDSLWRYMVGKKGNHTYSYNGQKIYIRVGGGGDGTTEEEMREKAVRKAVRALIEREGGDGATVKQRIDAKYRIGAVWCQKGDGRWEKVAEWDAEGRKMTMMGTAVPLQATVDKFLE